MDPTYHRTSILAIVSRMKAPAHNLNNFHRRAEGLEAFLRQFVEIPPMCAFHPGRCALDLIFGVLHPPGRGKAE